MPLWAMNLGWHDPMREPCLFHRECVFSSKSRCSRCEGTKPANGFYWYAYGETGSGRRSHIHKLLGFPSESFLLACRNRHSPSRPLPDHDAQRTFKFPVYLRTGTRGQRRHY